MKIENIKKLIETNKEKINAFIDSHLENHFITHSFYDKKDGSALLLVSAKHKTIAGSLTNLHIGDWE